jgi:hypothetical protein
MWRNPVRRRASAALNLALILAALISAESAQAADRKVLVENFTAST